jgi:hypothetical protein
MAFSDRPMTQAMHPAASHHMPWFLPGPDGSDGLMTFTTLVVLVTVFGVGVLFFKLHSLPERLGHKKLQFEIVAVLGLLSLFTHVHAFWVAGLLLALVDLPDFQTPLKSIAASLEAVAGTASPSVLSASEPLSNSVEPKSSETQPPPQQPQPPQHGPGA